MDDEREEELSTITAIYPELVIDPDDLYSVSLDLPVAPSEPSTVSFVASLLLGSGHDHDTSVPRDEHQLLHLPALKLKIVLPEGYPAEAGPRLALSTSPAWLPEKKCRELEDEATKLWDEYGRCQILFAYIDFLQQSAERLFDLPSPLSLAPSLKPSLLAFDATTRKQLFDAETFDCGVCLEPKKGSACHRLHRCGHVFCLSCLQDFYENCITEGDVVNVKCLDPDCGKSKDKPQGNERKRKRRADKTLHPSELLAMSIPESSVRRYVEMKRKKKLEADKTTIYCPRTWCQAPARSTKYPPIPTDLSQYADSDSDISDNENGPPPAYTKDTPENKMPAPADRLAICSKCTLAFCRICYTGWHGEFARCWPRNPGDLSEEEKASYDYIRLHTSPCPTCASPTQKTMGCNHMKCFQCNSHFCYLCGAWLDGSNPYQHFNKAGTGCFMRLWELEEGDEGAAGQGDVQFEGPRRWEAEARALAEEADREEAERLQGEEDQRAEMDQMRAVAWAAAPDHPVPDDRVAVPPRAPALPVAGVPPQVMAALAGWHAAPHVVNRAAVHPADAAVLGRRQHGQGPDQDPDQQPRRHPRHRGNGRIPRWNGDVEAPPALPAAPLDAEVDRRAAAAFRRFMELAERDEEDGWDSDDLDDGGDEGWEIPFRAR